MQLSCLSESEVIRLKSTLHALNDKKYLCSSCVSQTRPDLMEKKKQVMACTKSAPDWGIHTVEDGTLRYSYKRCIGNYFDHHSMSWLPIFNAYEKGIMPYPGAYQDQPNKALEIIQVIETSKNIEQIKRLEEQRSRANSRIGSRGR